MPEDTNHEHSGAMDPHAHLLHMLGAKDHEDAARIIGELHAAQIKPEAGQVPRETMIALREAEMIPSCDDYFAARSDHLDTRDRRNVFEAGFQRGFDAGFVAAPQPPALAKSEIEDLITECIPGGSVCDPQEVADNIRRYCNAWPDLAQAEARPGFDVLVNAGALQMVRNALKRDADEGKQSRREMLAELEATIRPVQAQGEVRGDEPATWREAVAAAYGHLWHVNNEPASPIPPYSPEKAAYEARKALRGLLTSEQRGEAINKVGLQLSVYSDDDTRPGPAAPQSESSILALLLAAGHVTQRQVDQARAIAAKTPGFAPSGEAEIAERERTKTLARWISATMATLESIDPDDMEDGGANLLSLLADGDALVSAVLRGAPLPASQPMSPAAPQAREADRLAALAKRNILDAIRDAYDLGYNDARNAKAVPGDSAPGYHGRDVEADHGSALFNTLQRRWLASLPMSGDGLSQAAQDVLAERRRQIEAEGWTPEHDDAHNNGELAEAAGCYALHHNDPGLKGAPAWWPWHAAWWKPADPRRNLIKAGALILAELERLDRASAHGIGSGTGQHAAAMTFEMAERHQMLSDPMHTHAAPGIGSGKGDAS